MTNVLKSYPRADEAYWLHLLRLCREHAWRRRQKLRAFSSAADWEGHCRAVRTRFRAALGPMPERTPLNPRVTGVLERDGYVVEKLLIESQPGLFVTANLYRPKQVRTPVPAILNPVGHWANSKAQDVVQARGIGLARKGYVALIFDPVGQGERSQFWDAKAGANPMPASTSQHSAACNPCFLIGQTVINFMVWDGVRMLDYLETRPEVDAGRIGCTGASGGGTHTMFMAAYDERIRAAVPVCSTSTYERMLAEGRIGEPCQDPAGTYRDDLDMADLLMCAAPAAVRVVAATYDFFPLVGAREVALDLKDCYAALSIPERADLAEVPSHHDYNRPMREAMYAWFNRWLGNEGVDATEAPFEPEPPERLWCTETGQVFTSLGGETVLSLNRARVRRLTAQSPSLADRGEAEAHRACVRAAVPEVLNYAGGKAHSPAKALDRASLEGLTVEQVAFETAPDLPVPGLVFIPSGRGPHPALLFLHDRGKDVEAGPEGLAQALARAGCLVMAVDLRGRGETAWRRRSPIEADDLGLLGDESMLAYVCYLLGEWALTQRVADTVRALDFLAGRPEVDPGRLGLVGRGGGALVAWHAAALDGRVKGVAAYETLASYRSIVEADRCAHPVSGFVPGVLLRYDLPDLVGALAPARVFVANPAGAAGETLSPEMADAAYARTRRMYGLLGGSLHVKSGLSRPELVEQMKTWAVGL